MGRWLREVLRDDTGTTVGVFLLALPLGILGVYLPLYAEELGASGTEIGALFTAFSLTGVLARPLVGFGADKLGRKPFIVAGAGCYVLATMLFALAVSLPFLFAARLAQGVGSALFWVAALALLADLRGGDSRGRAFGLLLGSANAGGIVGTVAGFGAVELLGVRAGWRLSFGAFVLSTCFALARFARRVPRPAPLAGTPPVRPAASRTLLFLLGVSFLTAASYTLVLPIVLLFLRDRFGASLFVIGLAYAPASLALVALPPRLGGLSDRYGRGRVLRWALLSSAVASTLYPLAPSLWLLAAMWTVEAALASAALPARDAIVSELSGGDVRGRAYGFYAAATGLGASVGPLIGGWLYDNAGRSWPFWGNSMLLVLAAVLIAWKLPETRHSASMSASRFDPVQVPEGEASA